MRSPASADTATAADGAVSLAEALRHLNDAVDRLSAAARALPDGGARDLPAELQAMADDRSRLADELDAAKARGDRLSDVNGEVSRRLVGAMETVRGVLEAEGS